MMNAIKAEYILPDLRAATKKEVLQEMAEAVHGVYDTLASVDIFNALQERESLGSTGIGEGIAIPHAKLKQLEEILVFFGKSAKGVPFDAQDNKGVHLFFLLLAPEGSSAPYLSSLAQLSKFLKGPTVRSRLLRAEGKEALLEILTES